MHDSRFLRSRLLPGHKHREAGETRREGDRVTKRNAIPQDRGHEELGEEFALPHGKCPHRHLSQSHPARDNSVL